MIRRPPRSTLSSSSAASDVYKRQERMQTGNSSTMIFTVAELVSYISKYMTLMPGDVITTGTPPGVGMARKPRIFLKPGDEMVLTVAGLGEQRATVVALD